MSFWKKQPLEINEFIGKQIVSNETILENINILSKNYNVYSNITDNKLIEFTEFINNNYISGPDNFKMIYSKNLIKYYLNKNFLLIEFYNSNKIIGYIVGKKIKMSIYNKLFDIIEVNFLCISQEFRHMKLGPILISVLTKESILKYDISVAHYTISEKIKSPHYSIKEYYHRIININILLNTKFIEGNKELLEQEYNTFNKVISSKIQIYINLKDDIKNYYNEYIKYYKNNYDIYQYLSFEEFKEIMYNKDFYNFTIIQNNEINLVSMYKIDVETPNGIYKNGNYYIMVFTSDNKNEILESLNEYIYINDIFDVITFSEIFERKLDKCINGNVFSKYYLYNMSCPKIEFYRNGMITI